MKERWKAIIGYETLYQVSDHGKVRSLGRTISFSQIQSGKLCVLTRSVRSKLLKPIVLSAGYLQVALYDEFGEVQRFLVHRLVATYFVRKVKSSSDCVMHKDDNPSNCHYRNLKWGTPKLNSEDMVQKERSCRGEKQGCSKLCEDDVRYIFATNGLIEDLAAEFGVTAANISAIKTGKTWNHVTGLPSTRKRK